ncbi:hypothetical protein PIROE2DRAFT_13019 [Piromyces sp. E2]|nr:hypothetical protein PIROE2DRAFT_13019 [Piromyces sp. E2]|eukprot:OUM61066.1 hypothetical protein PIROE2DRAFT_13019 [Piromyces sp. E2]
MSNSNEEIVQVISLFRHGKRYAFENLDTHDFIPSDLCEDGIDTTIAKGKQYVDKYFKAFSESPFNDTDFKCFISDTARTIKTIIYRLSDFVPQVDLKHMKLDDLKEFTQKNIPNSIYDDNIFKSYVYSNDVAYKFFKSDPDFKYLLSEIESEIGNKSKKALELYESYYNQSLNKGLKIQQIFTEEHLIIKEAFEKLNANKRIMDVNFSHKKSLLCCIHQLISRYYEEMKKVKDNAPDKKKIVLFSAHDLYLTCLVQFLEVVDKRKYNYSFDDEINFVIFKKKDKPSNKLYVRFEYNDELMEVPFSSLKNKSECDLDTLLEKIEKEYVCYTFEEIKSLCDRKINDELFPKGVLA